MFLILTLFSTSLAFGETSETTCSGIDINNDEEFSKIKAAKIKASTSKLFFTETNSVFYVPPESLTRSFQLFNISNETAQIKKLVVGELVAKEQPSKSVAPEFLSTIFDAAISNKCISKYSDSNASVTKNLFLELSGTWTGKVFVFGYNFEPVEIDLELIVKHDPIELIGFTLFGISIAVGFGFFITWHSLSLAKGNEVDSKMRLLRHVNGHIKQINKLRNNKPSDQWNEILENHLTVLHDVGRNISFITEDIETTYRDLEHSLSNNQEIANNNKELELIKPKGWDPEQLKEVPKDALSLSNLVFALIAISVAVPLTLFSKDYLLGIPVVDVIISMGIGFSIYRAKDLGKIVKSIFNPE